LNFPIVLSNHVPSIEIDPKENCFERK